MSLDANTAKSSAANGSESFSTRHIALHIFSDVFDRKLALDHVLETNRTMAALSGRDRAFVRMLVSTALRRLGQIDDFIRRATDGKDDIQPPRLKHILRLGAAQIVFMAVPDHAAVDTAVHLAEDEKMGRGKGLVNAVLRRIAREHSAWVQKQDDARLNIPDWLLKSWIEDYGLSAAADIAKASLAEAPLDISVKVPGDLSYWEGTLSATKLPFGNLRRIEGGDVRQLSGFDDGMWWVQDASAYLPALLLGDIDGKTVIDMCAAPGGKTAQLAAQGAHVIALDRSTARLKRLHENMRRLRLEDQVKAEAADAAAWTTKIPPEAILLDAPCSATGTIRRHPDILVLKSPRDVQRLIEIQARILDHACDVLAPGGTLVYCTCSIQKAEGETQIKTLLERNKKMVRIPIKPDEISGTETFITPDGDMRILPYHLAAMGGMDGFFIARLQKQ